MKDKGALVEFSIMLDVVQSRVEEIWGEDEPQWIEAALDRAVNLAARDAGLGGLYLARVAREIGRWN